MGLSVGGGGVGADLGGGDDGWVVEVVRCWLVAGLQGLWRALEDFPHGLPLFLDLRRDMFLVSLERRSGECGRGVY